MEFNLIIGIITILFIILVGFLMFLMILEKLWSRSDQIKLNNERESLMDEFTEESTQFMEDFYGSR